MSPHPVARAVDGPKRLDPTAGLADVEGHAPDQLRDDVARAAALDADDAPAGNRREMPQPKGIEQAGFSPTGPAAYESVPVGAADVEAQCEARRATRPPVQEGRALRHVQIAGPGAGQRGADRRGQQVDRR